MSCAALRAQRLLQAAVTCLAGQLRDATLRQGGGRRDLVVGPAVVPQDARPVRFGEDGKMILPRTVSSNNETNVHAIEAKEVSIDWEALLKLAKCTNPSQVNRKSLRGMWMCLAVQHVQQRGEKPFLKCQIWVDRGHPDWNDKPEIEFQEFGESLCVFEVEQVAA